MRSAPGRRPSRLVTSVTVLLAGFAAIFVDATQKAVAAESPTGAATGLPVPRYVSLRSDRVNMRQGPSKEHGTLWIYRRAGLPVEITAEFENWRRIRDSDGAEGWVLHSLLSGKRTAMVKPWQKDGLIEVREKPNGTAAVAARLEPRVVASVRKCDQNWCRISSPDFDGYVPQKELWGVYPDEKLN